MSSSPSHLTPAEQVALGELVEAVRARMASEVHEILLFGSRARGEGTPDSDVDVAVVVTDEGRRRRNEIYDLAYDIGLARGVLLAPLVITRARLEELRAPIRGATSSRLVNGMNSTIALGEPP